MKFTLSENAISSLSIAIEHFKKFYYLEEKFTTSEIDEAIKISLVFLENSIELMLKVIIANIDQLAIYLEPDSRVIQNARARANETTKLEDILISEGNFKTIRYTDAVEKYNSIYHNSDKVYHILKTLGDKRNAITHFGIDQTQTHDELIICFINAFDVIYNYLYPQLIELDSIGDYFTSNELIVQTIHGNNILFDENFIYNNIVDFLDELMETSRDYICSLRASEPNSRIFEFTKMIQELFEDRKFEEMISRNNAEITFNTCDYENNDFYFEISKGAELLDVIGSRYSPFFNVTAFCGEGGEIYFLVIHDKHEIYLYNHYIKWPQSDEPEIDYQWLKDCENGYCKKYNLSKRNLLFAFESLFTEMEDLPNGQA